MPHIQKLSPHVADLIAAGEVVERPASVVKELVENAIDAKASAVVVEIQNGGMTSIRITDDGCGIPPEELPTAFLRHATSKLREPGDLAAIGTLGFRGEALAAISAVSRIDIFTRTKDAPAGASLSLEGGTPGRVDEAGCPEGTTIVVRELFFNTPARLKFMKSDAAESAAVGAVVGQIALSHPELSIRYLRDGKEELHTPGDGKLLSAVYAVRGRDFAKSLLPVEGAGESITVRGFVTVPEAARGSRSMQTFFCCGRLIKSSLLTAALEEAYANRQLKGKFPGCVLDISLPLQQVDVNVHPAKTVVKFLNERAVFSAVHHIVCDALDRKAAPAARPDAGQGFFRTMDAQQFRAEAVHIDAGARSGQTAAAPPGRISEQQRWRGGEPVLPKQPTVINFPNSSVTPAPPREQPAPQQKATPPQREAEPAAPPPAAPEQTAMPQLQHRPWRYVGEVLRTYIVADDGEDVWLIDKHAAHERINFDRLKARQEPVMRQQLLSAMAVELPREQYAALLENLPLLDEFGFEAEDFGGGTLLVRAIPSEIDPGLVRETLEMLAEKLLSGANADPAAARDAMLHTMACKAAIKGGWQSDPAELRSLVDKVQSGEVQYCPHGRPVKVKLSRREIEKMFKRA